MMLQSFKIRFATKSSLAKIFIKIHIFQLIDQKLNSNGFFRSLVVTHYFKIQFPTKTFLAIIFQKPKNEFERQRHIFWRRGSGVGGGGRSNFNIQRDTYAEHSFGLFQKMLIIYPMILYSYF